MTYKAINWSPNELLGESKTDQLGENAQWLFNNTPRLTYTLPGGISRKEGLKMASGRVLISKNLKSDSATVNVRFGNFFTARCEPIITTGVVANQVKIHCTIKGIGRLVPDHRGFDAQVNIASEWKEWDRIGQSFYVTWNAVGY